MQREEASPVPEGRRATRRRTRRRPWRDSAAQLDGNRPHATISATRGSSRTASPTGTPFKGPGAVWFRLAHPLVQGEAPSPYQRVAVAADSGNGISAALDLGSTCSSTAT